MAKVIPEDLRTLARNLDAQVSPHLDNADRLHRTEAQATDGMFTSFTFTLASVYAVATEFMGQELQSKRDDIAAFGSTLTTTADNWQRAEDQSTIHNP